MKFEYPINTNNAVTALGHNNTVGCYPVGRLFNWHGGLHVGERGYTPVKAIADGVVVAYRMAKESIDINGIKISNGFVLILHTYTSPQGRILKFYSLYNHLMDYTELQENKKLPDFLKEDGFKVKQDNKDQGKDVKGLNLRTSGTSKASRKMVAVVPQGTVCQLVSTEKISQGFVMVNYTSPNKTQYKNHLLWCSKLQTATEANRFVKIDEQAGTVIVLCDDDSGKSGDKGLHLRSTPKGDNNANIIKVLPRGTQLKIDSADIGRKAYQKVTEINGEEQTQTAYVWHKCIEPTKQDNFKEDKLDKITTGANCNISIKAGETIGYTGLCGFKRQENYRACHVEVFTDIDPAEFLKGKTGDKDDVANNKKYLKIAQGATLSLKHPGSLKKGDEVKVLTFSQKPEDEYCKVSLHRQVRTVSHSDLDYINDTAKKDKDSKTIAAQYNPKKDKLEGLNISFNHTLSKDSVLNLAATINDEKNKPKKRKVAYTPTKEYTYWVKKADLNLSSKPAEPYALTSDITTLYHKQPLNNKTEFTLNHNYIESKAELKKDAIKLGEQTWCYISTKTPEEKEYGFKQVEGFIKSDDSNISEISAFDWEAFGFKTYNDQPDTFVYNNTVKPLEKISTPAFLQTIWQLIDEDDNKQLSSPELDRALNSQHVQQKLSKMVCYHQSEWGVDFGSLKKEIEVLLDEGIELEKDQERKQKLETEKEITLNTIEQKIKVFNFWSEVKTPACEVPDDMTYDPWGDRYRKRHYNEKQILHPDDEAKSKLPPFPVDTKVWHFHPIAFVEQMRRMGGINYSYDRKYIAKPNEVYINVIAPKNRHLQGPLIVFDDSGILLKTHSLCRGSNSDRLKGGGNGDTPTGRATTFYNSKAHKGSFSYGNYGLIYLTGESGEFKDATQKGRAGIAIHGGHTVGYYKKSLKDEGQLMSTFGCIRVYNGEMEKLGKLYAELKNKGKTIYCYIEDYEGDIRDVYSYYDMQADSKDTAQTERSTKQ